MEGAVLAAAPKVLSALGAAHKVAGIAKMASKGKKIVNRAKAVAGAASKVTGGIRKARRTAGAAIGAAKGVVKGIGKAGGVRGVAKKVLTKYNPGPAVHHGSGIVSNMTSVMKKKIASSAPKAVGSMSHFSKVAGALARGSNTLMGGTHK